MPPRMSGYNILVQNASRENLNRLKDHFRRNPPGISVVFIEAGFIDELRQVSPNTLYIFRDVLPQGGTDDHIYERIDPVAYVDHLHRRAPAGAAIYLGNEPFDLGRINQWTLPALDRCDQLGRRGVVLNLSPGRPEPGDWTGVLAPLLRRMNNTQHIMGLHEYWGPGKKFVPWWIGRAKFLYEACDQLGVSRPPIAYTEIGLLGFADGGRNQDVLDPFGGWTKLGVSGDQYADDLIECYRIWEQQPTVLGAAIFCFGTWNGCEVESSPQSARLFERLEQYQPMSQPTPPPIGGQPPAPPTPPAPPAQPASVPKPDNAGDPVTARVTKTASFEFINVRSGPNTTFAKRAEIRAGDTITYYPNTRRQGGTYEWMYVVKTEGIAPGEGWFAFGLTTLEAIPVTPPTPPPTPPVQPPAPPPVTPPVQPPPAPTGVTLTDAEMQTLEGLVAEIARLNGLIADSGRQLGAIQAQIVTLLARAKSRR